MNVLFVSSGNHGVSPIIKNQAESLIKQGINVSFFPIKGKGLKGYLNNISKLKKHIRENKYDIVHAHYSLTAFVASMSFAKPLVVSLMGSDVKKGLIYRLLIKFFALIFSWKTIIVKSEDMKASLKIKRAIVVPNGVDLERFIVREKNKCQEELMWDTNKRHILFPANIQRPEKNFQLLEQAISLINNNNIEIHWFNNIPNEQAPIWYNAADLVVMTSFWEGSPNAIKEAMACCRPIISTDVGDVKWVFEGIDGCFITDYTPEMCSNLILTALNYEKTTGRESIINKGLSSEIIAKKLEKIYLKNKAS